MNTKIIAATIFICGAVLLAIFAVSFSNAPQNRAGSELTPIGTEAFGGPYNLTNHLGERVTEKDLDGQYKLIYFGFTYCPAICPTELAKMTEALDILGDEGEQIQPVFITIDPERDTVDVMKDYVSLFHPRLVGYTGTPEEIERVKKAYKVYSAKVNDPNMSEYTVDHSSYIYFIGPNEELYSLFRTDDTAQDMASTIHQWLEQNRKNGV